MKVVCNIREADNIVRYGSTAYHFKKEDDVLVCDVQDEAAVRYLLQFPEFSLAAPSEEVEEYTPTENRYEMMTLEELQDLYRERFGRAAHPSMKHETLVERLCAHSNS